MTWWRSRTVRWALIAVVSASPGLSQEPVERGPVLISPGAPDLVSRIASSCPTFSWEPVAAASSHQLAVFRMSPPDSSNPAGAEEPMLVLTRELPGRASSWTPDLEDCLSPGGRYAWAVRALGAEASGPWSDPAAFEVDSTPGRRELQQAFERVERELAERPGARAAAGDPETLGPGPPGSVDREPVRLPRATVAPTRLSVAGNVDATSFTGDGAALSGVATSADLTAHAGDDSAHHAPTVDTTCDGVACDGTSFTNVTAVAGDSATGFFSSGEIEEARIDAAIARDTEVPSLEVGDISGVTAGTGLLGGGTSGNVALSADTVYLQRRVNAACTPGFAIRSISGAGSVTCEADAGSGSFTLSIDARTCTPQGDFPSGDTGACSNGSVLRTDGTNVFPCLVRGTGSLRTYLCDLDLPTGAWIDEIVAHGRDSSSDGYYEASVWRTEAGEIDPIFISSFGGTWQSSGVGATPGFGSFDVFPDTDLPHTVLAGSRYLLGFATVAPTGDVAMLSFEVEFSVP